MPMILCDYSNNLWTAVRELGYSGADVARLLGVTNSCLTRFVASGRKPDVDGLINKL
jgi:predicted transcriptional regulator